MKSFHCVQIQETLLADLGFLKCLAWPLQRAASASEPGTEPWGIQLLLLGSSASLDAKWNHSCLPTACGCISKQCGYGIAASLPHHLGRRLNSSNVQTPYLLGGAPGQLPRLHHCKSLSGEPGLNKHRIGTKDSMRLLGNSEPFCLSPCPQSPPYLRLHPAHAILQVNQNAAPYSARDTNRNERLNESRKDQDRGEKRRLGW